MQSLTFNFYDLHILRLVVSYVQKYGNFPSQHFYIAFLYRVNFHIAFL